MSFGVFEKRFALTTKTFSPYKAYNINRTDEQEMVRLKHIEGSTDFYTAQC